MCSSFRPGMRGSGLPPLEAMRLGTPTIVSTAGAFPEICADVCARRWPRTTRIALATQTAAGQLASGSREILAGEGAQARGTVHLAGSGSEQRSKAVPRAPLDVCGACSLPLRDWDRSAPLTHPRLSGAARAPSSTFRQAPGGHSCERASSPAPEEISGGEPTSDGISAGRRRAGPHSPEIRPRRAAAAPRGGCGWTARPPAGHVVRLARLLPARVSSRYASTTSSTCEKSRSGSRSPTRNSVGALRPRRDGHDLRVETEGHHEVGLLAPARGG